MEVVTELMRHISLYCLLLLLLTVEGPFCRASASCGQCDNQGHKVTAAAPLVLAKLNRTILPDLARVSLARVQEEPFIFELLVSDAGTVCHVKELSSWDRAVASELVTTIQRWTFSPAIFEGTVICMAARMLVYVRRTNGVLEVVIPGLTDRRAK